MTRIQWDMPKEGAITPEQQLQQDVMDAVQRRAYHLAGNKTWCEDWRQYIANNHPVLALIGCGNKYNDYITSSTNSSEAHRTNSDMRRRRFLVFVCSLCCGITISLGAYLWSTQNEKLSEIMFRMTFVSYPEEDQPNSERAVYADYARYQIYLWTWMSILHAVHDLNIWYCCCCFTSSESSTKVLRGYILWAILLVAGVTGLLVGVILSESDNSNDLEQEDGGEDDVDEVDIVVTLLVNILVEIFLAWIIWFPIIATILFSGILGCFIVPILGGRRQQLYALGQNQRNPPTKKAMTMKSLAEYDGVDANA